MRYNNTVSKKENRLKKKDPAFLAPLRVCLLLSVLMIWLAGCSSVVESPPVPDPGGDPDDPPVEVFDKWDLWIKGTQLRGANIYQRRVYPELDGTEFLGAGPIGPPYTQEDFTRLAALGANYVNISHAGVFSEKPPYVLEPAILDNLTRLVTLIRNAGMFAVISYRSGPGRSEFTFFWGEDGDWFDASYYNDRIWVDPEAQAAWAEMWRETARRFAAEKCVAGYDLMVEPNANNVYFNLWDPGEFHNRYGGTLYDWNRFFPNITAAIRSVDPKTPILTGAMSYSNVAWLPWLQPSADTRTVYMVHQYDPFLYTHQEAGGIVTYPGNIDADYDGTPEWVDKNWLLRLMSKTDEFRRNHPEVNAVGCNEYGVTRWVPNAPAYLDDMMDIFESRGMNYAIWVWEPAYRPWSEQVTDFYFRFGPDPACREDMDNNALITVIKKYWSRNTRRPPNDRQDGKRAR